MRVQGLPDKPEAFFYEKPFYQGSPDFIDTD